MVKLYSAAWFSVDLRLFLLGHACFVFCDAITKNNDDVSILVGSLTSGKVFGRTFLFCVFVQAVEDFVLQIYH